jgi:hypothetical protein
MYGFCGYSHSTLLTFEVFSARLSKLTFSLECKTSLTVAMPPDWHLFDLEWVRVSCLFFTPSTQHSSTPHGQSRNHPLLTPHPHTYSTSAPPHLHWPSVAFLLLMDVERLSIYDTDECNSATPLNATGLFYMTLMNVTVPPRWMLRDFFIWHWWMQQCHPAECYGTFLWLLLLMLELSSDTVDSRYPTIDDACVIIGTTVCII